MNFIELSIRARMAYAILCLQQLLNHDQVKNTSWDILLDKLWLFTSIEFVDDWLYIISNYLPPSILYDRFKDLELISYQEYLILNKLYKNSNKEIHDILEIIFNLGTVELYSTIVYPSKKTLDLLNQIINILKYNQIVLPTSNQLEKYRIDSNNGWGEKFHKEFLK